jgi:hypothetical protein
MIKRLGASTPSSSPRTSCRRSRPSVSAWSSSTRGASPPSGDRSTRCARADRGRARRGREAAPARARTRPGSDDPAAAAEALVDGVEGSPSRERRPRELATWWCARRSRATRSKPLVARASAPGSACAPVSPGRLGSVFHALTMRSRARRATRENCLGHLQARAHRNFCSPLAYVVMVAFLSSTGWCSGSSCRSPRTTPRSPARAAPLQMFFGSTILSVLTLLVFCPATHHAHLRRRAPLRTFETLFTAPVTDDEVVAGKYFGRS